MPKPPRRESLGPDLGSLLRALIRRSGLSVDAISLASGVSRGQIFRALKPVADSERRVPTLETLERICRAAGAHVADLYDPALEPIREPEMTEEPC